MNIKKITGLIAALLLVMAIFGSVAFAATGGLLNGKGMTTSAGATEYNITDNNTSTSFKLYGTSASYSFAYPVNVTAIYYKIYVLNGFKIVFYNSSGTALKTLASGSGLSAVSGTLSVAVTNVSKVTVSGGTSASNYIYEFDVFGSYVLPVPTNVQATAGVKKIDLSFTGATGAIGYKVYMNGALYTTLAADSTGTTIPDLNPDTSYTFQVSALYNNSLESELSATATATPMNEIVLPELTAAVGKDKITLYWTAPNGATESTLYRSSGTKVVTYTTADDNSYTVTGLTPQTTYSFYVISTDKYGRELKSNVYSFTTTSAVDTEPPATPKSLKASMSGDMSNIILSWAMGSEDDLAGYNLEVSINGGEYKKLATMIDQTSYSLANPTPESTYSFRLYAVDDTGNISTDPAEATLTVPKRDTEAAQTIQDGVLTLTWEPVTGAVAYEIYLNGKLVKEVSADTLSTTITKAEGYKADALENVAKVKALFADGSTGGSSTSGTTALSGDWGFTPASIILNAATILASLASFILLRLVILYVPILIGYIREAAKPQ